MLSKYTAFFILLWSSASIAVPPIPTVRYTLDIDPSCGQVNANVPRSGVNANSLVLRFQNFEVSSQFSEQSGAGNLASRECSLRANVVIPAGIKFYPKRAFIDGEVATSETGWAQVRFAYTWNGQEEIMARLFQGSLQDIFLLTKESSYNWYASTCRPYRQNVSISGHFLLNAAHRDSDRNFSDIALFNAEQQSTLTSRWMWAWTYCNPWLNYEYDSRYSRFGQREIKGKTVLNGFEGFYETQSGKRGVLHGINYSDDYQEARGFWRFEDGQSGWFIFFLAPQNEKQFSGLWGTGFNIGKNPKGEWTGGSY